MSHIVPSCTGISMSHIVQSCTSLTSEFLSQNEVKAQTYLVEQYYITQSHSQCIHQCVVYVLYIYTSYLHLSLLDPALEDKYFSNNVHDSSLLIQYSKHNKGSCYYRSPVSSVSSCNIIHICQGPGSAEVWHKRRLLIEGRVENLKSFKVEKNQGATIFNLVIVW